MAELFPFLGLIFVGGLAVIAAGVALVIGLAMAMQSAWRGARRRWGISGRRGQ